MYTYTFSHVDSYKLILDLCKHIYLHSHVRTSIQGFVPTAQVETGLGGGGASGDVAEHRLAAHECDRAHMQEQVCVCVYVFVLYIYIHKSL